MEASLNDSSKTHLTDEELNQYADNAAALRSTGADHLQSCPQCRDRASQMIAQQRKLDSLREFTSTSPAGDCPNNDIWALIAVAAISEEDAATALVHAGTCSRCARRLQIAIEDRDADLEQHESLIDSLPSSTPKGMAREAQRLARASRGGSKPFIKRARVWLAAAAILILAATSILVRRPNPVGVNRLLTFAYESGRDIELRLPGAGYAPLGKDLDGYATAPQPMAGARSTSPPPVSGLAHSVSERRELRQIRDLMAKTQALSEASDKIALELMRRPHGGRWLDPRGREELLAGQYDKAIPDLEKARALLPDNPSVLGETWLPRASSVGRQDICSRTTNPRFAT